MRGGYGFRAEVPIEQYRQGGEAAVSGALTRNSIINTAHSKARSILLVQTCSRHTAIDITKIT